MTHGIQANHASLVTVVVITFNSRHFTERCFEALLAQSFTKFEVIVVDNASRDGGPQLPQDSRFRLISLGRNVGFAAANNLAASKALSPWLATLNPDAFPATDWIERLLEGASRAPQIAMVGSLQVCSEDENRLDGVGDCYSPLGVAWRGLYGRPLREAPPTGEVFGPCAAAALYRLDAFRGVGGFDEDYFCYHEDVDLAFRLRLRGHRCIQCMEARVVHVGSGIAGKNSDFAVYHGTRNRVWTFVKCMPLPLLILLGPLHIAANLYLLVGSLRAQLGGPVLRGLRDSVLGLTRMWRKRNAVHQAGRLSPLRIAFSFTWSMRAFRRMDHDVRVWR